MDFNKVKTEENIYKVDNNFKTTDFIKQEPQDEVVDNLNGINMTFASQDLKGVHLIAKIEPVKKEISNYCYEDDPFEEEDEDDFKDSGEAAGHHSESKEFTDYTSIKYEQDDMKCDLISIVKIEDNILMNTSTQLYEGCISIKTEAIEEETKEKKTFKLESEQTEKPKLRPYRSKYNIPMPKKKKGEIEVRSRNGKICKPKVEIFCDHCGLKMYTYQGMLHHMKVKHNDNVQLFECYHCGQKMVSKNWLTRHIDAKHSKHGKLFKCPHCPYENKWKQTVSRHVRVMHAKTPRILKCTYCDFTSAWDSTIRKHYMKRHMDIEEVAAKYSKSKTWDSDNKKIINKEHRCEICDYTTFHKPNLRKHITQLHGGSTLTLKYKEATKYKCDLCDFVTVYRGSYTTHRQGKHNIGGEEHKCEQCSYVTRAKKYLMIHMKKHKPVNNSKSGFICGHCEACYKSKVSLIKHISTTHPRIKSEIKNDTSFV